MNIRSKFNIDKTRESFGKRLGEIIEDVIGDDRVRELFDAAGKHPDEYEGKPTGMMALDLGVISPDTKTALLVGQAAVRTLAVANNIQNYAGGRPSNEPLSVFDDVFKFVGSERDPDVLKRAQGNWQAAEMANNYIRESSPAGERDSVNGGMSGGDIADILRASAKNDLAAAFKILRAEGHMEAAANVNALGASVYVANENAFRFSPAAVVNDVMQLGNGQPDRAEDFAALGEKLVQLTGQAQIYGDSLAQKNTLKV